MGWQGKDPSTDFRGGGFISLENLLYFAKNYPKSFEELLCKQNGDRALWEYPFAVAGVNITFMLIQMLDLQAAKPRSLIGAVFLNLLIGTVYYNICAVLKSYMATIWTFCLRIIVQYSSFMR
uniref:ELMO domain-containing protein n=2 Tax=Aegilops tauschii subsp. strangulata TaxID=200361 RepID=A0A453CKF5_AEGTS